MNIKPEQRLTKEQVDLIENLVMVILKDCVEEYEEKIRYRDPTSTKKDPLFIEETVTKKRLSDYGRGYKDGFAELFVHAPILPEGMKAASIIDRSEEAALLE